MSTSIDAKTTAVPASRVMNGFACLVCDKFFVAVGDETSARYLAGTCCAPRACGDCQKPCEDKYYIVCRACREARADWKWAEAPRVEAGKAMIYCDAWDHWCSDVGEYEDECDHREVPVGSGRPYVAAFHRARVPDLSEIIADDMYEDWDGREDWLDEIQAAVEKAFKENAPGAWHAGGSVPILTPAPETHG